MTTPYSLTYSSIPTLTACQMGNYNLVNFSGTVGAYASPLVSTLTLANVGVYLIYYILNYYNFPSATCVVTYRCRCLFSDKNKWFSSM